MTRRRIKMANDYLVHHGVLGMKWGIRRYQPYSTVPRGSGKRGKEIGDAKKHKYARSEKMNTNDERDTKTTRGVKKDYNELSDQDFAKKYKVNKDRYRKRVNKYGDPYAHSKNSVARKNVSKITKQSIKHQQKLKKAAKVAGAVGATAVAAYVILKAFNSLNLTTKQKMDLLINNQTVSLYAINNGLKTYSKGIASPQTVKKAVTNGRKIVENDLLKYF